MYNGLSCFFFVKMEFLLEWGYLGLFIGTFLAATIMPLASEFLLVALILAGADPIKCFVFATAGNWLGGLTTFGIGWLGKWEWIEKYLRVSHEKLLKQKRIIDKIGPLAALLSWVPLVGDIFAVALGFYKLSPIKCAIYMLIGKSARFAAWIFVFEGR